jgi:hypothetical protein
VLHPGRNLPDQVEAGYPQDFRDLLKSDLGFAGRDDIADHDHPAGAAADPFDLSVQLRGHRQSIEHGDEMIAARTPRDGIGNRDRLRLAQGAHEGFDRPDVRPRRAGAHGDADG